MSCPADDDFVAFFERVYPRAVAAARRATGSGMLAEDAAVEALARAHRGWKRISRLAWRDAWVLRVATREAIRQASRRSGYAVGSEACADELDHALLRIALVTALEKLPRRQREAIALRYLCDFSEHEVAVALGISNGSVKVHVSRALTALRRSIGTQLREDEINGLLGL